MTKREHKREMIRLLQGVLAQPNARTAAQKQLFLLKASMLTKIQIKGK